MLKVGLTGGIGCGKSTVADAFSALGVPIIDADKIARHLVQPDEPALLEIVKQFGHDALLGDGKLNRRFIKEKVFVNKLLLIKLENILHPLIQADIQHQFSKLVNDKATTPSLNYEYIIVDVPLLYEKNYEGMFDKIIVVDCLPAQQISRVKNRDGMNEELVRSIMKQQADRKDRLSIATDIIENTKHQNYLKEQVSRLHLKFLNLNLKSN